MPQWSPLALPAQTCDLMPVHPSRAATSRQWSAQAYPAALIICGWAPLLLLLVLLQCVCVYRSECCQAGQGASEGHFWTEHHSLQSHTGDYNDNTAQISVRFLRFQNSPKQHCFWITQGTVCLLCAANKTLLVELHMHRQCMKVYFCTDPPCWPLARAQKSTAILETNH